MIKKLVKSFLLLFYPLSDYLYKREQNNNPYLCVITPVFDGASTSIKSLVEDLKKQSFPNFVHILISNGPSPKIKKYLDKINDNRFKYVELKKESQNGWRKLQNNIGKRKNYAMKNFLAERYVFIDADSQIIDKNFISKLYISQIFFNRDIIVLQIKLRDIILPRFPIFFGHIDLTNYTFSRKIALNSTYPQRLTTDYFLASDYLFFKQIYRKNNVVFLDFVYLLKDSRRSYKSVGEIIDLEVNS